MKIGILTLPLHTNYGGILQAYALQTVLERMGYEACVIQRPWRKQIVWWKYPLQIVKRCINRFILGYDNSIFGELRWNKNQAIIERNTQKFINNHIHAHQIRQISDIKEKDFGAIVVGSDQIWRPKYFRLHYKYIEDAFLSFTAKWNVKRIAYAASFGTDKWEYNEEESKECSRLLTLFDAVSVREKNAIGLCQKYLGRRDVQHVLDPTLLLKKEDYMSLVSQAKTECSPGNLMCYILDLTDDKKSLVDKIANERGLNAFYTNSKVEDDNALQNERIQPPVEQWLRGFMDAKFVVTDSFHACVFSIIFGKPFVVIGNKERGMARFMSLLEMFSLHNNLICDINDYNPAYSYGINTSVDEMLDNNRQLSIQFLKNALV